MAQTDSNIGMEAGFIADAYEQAMQERGVVLGARDVLTFADNVLNASNGVHERIEELMSRGRQVSVVHP